jgi:integrase
MDLIGNHGGGYLLEHRSSAAIQSRVKRSGARWKPHDLRRTFSTRLAGLGTPIHVIEKMLNHSLGGVMAIYNRHEYGDERIAAAEVWADELQRIVK